MAGMVIHEDLRKGFLEEIIQNLIVKNDVELSEQELVSYLIKKPNKE